MVVIAIENILNTAQYFKISLAHPCCFVKPMSAPDALATSVLCQDCPSTHKCSATFQGRLGVGGRSAPSLTPGEAEASRYMLLPSPLTGEGGLQGRQEGTED